jgi:hypothetical protein
VERRGEERKKYGKEGTCKPISLMNIDANHQGNTIKKNTAHIKEIILCDLVDPSQGCKDSSTFASQEM